MNHTEAITKASEQFGKSLGLSPLKSSEGLVAEVVFTRTDEFKIKAGSRPKMTAWLESRGFKTLLIGTEYEILSKDVMTRKRVFNVRVCLWSNAPRMSVRFSTTVPVTQPIESLSQWLLSKVGAPAKA